MKKKADDHLRITLFLVLVVACFGLILYRLFVLSYVRHGAYARTAQAQIDHVTNILARGTISFEDKNGTTSIAAMNKKFAVATVTPRKVDPAARESLARTLAGIVGLSESAVAKTLAGESDTARVLARRLTDEQVGHIKALNARGVAITYEMDRSYPNGALAADVLGFLGYDGSARAGQYGIEAAFNQELFGKDAASAGRASFAASVFGQSRKGSALPQPSDVVLTIDPIIQNFVESRLDALLKKWSAASGSAIVQDPRTGKILAMVDRPTFDPNDYSTSPPAAFLNSTVQEIFEPGSSFKPITMAAGLDLGKITPQTSFEDTGFVEIDGYRIKNFSEKVFGRVTMAQVLEKSINTGTMFVQKLIGNSKFTDYVVNMGFGQETDVDLPGEVNGDISNLYSGRKINYLTASFGQGIAVTPLQLINAYSAIANGGKLMRPYVVDRIIRESGAEEKTKPEIVGIPITEKTAQKLKTMLVGVVNNGFDKARIAGYDIAGKTGTAQIPDSKGAYLEDQYIHNFLGFAPAYDARFTVLIKMDKPQGITFAADSISPTFREITDFLLKYYNIPPTH